MEPCGRISYNYRTAACAREIQIMWCERILGNFATYPPRRWDYVDVEWFECGRIVKRVSRGGVNVRVLLPPGQRFGHGDVISDDGEAAIAIEVKPSEMLVVTAIAPRLLAVLALELGNLHCPTEITDSAEVIFPEDGPTLAVLDKLGLSASRQLRRFNPLPNPVGMTVSIAADFAVVRA